MAECDSWIGIMKDLKFRFFFLKTTEGFHLVNDVITFTYQNRNNFDKQDSHYSHL